MTTRFGAGRRLGIHRRLMMNDLQHLTPRLADEYASWFQCLADGTRIQILHMVATADGSVTVGEIVKQIGKSQSTVSKHLQILASQRFVFTKPDGVRTLVRVNDACMTALPNAAATIMASRIPADG